FGRAMRGTGPRKARDGRRETGGRDRDSNLALAFHGLGPSRDLQRAADRDSVERSVDPAGNRFVVELRPPPDRRGRRDPAAGLEGGGQARVGKRQANELSSREL